MNPWPMVLADVKGMRGVALAIIAVISIAIAIIIGLSSQERALRTASAQAADDFPIIVGASGSATQLVMSAVYLEPDALPLINESVIERVRNDLRVKAFTFIATGDVYREYPIVGINVDFVERWGRLPVKQGRVFSASDEAVIGAAVRMRLGDIFEPSHGAQHNEPGKIPDHEEDNRHSDIKFKIVGQLPFTASKWDKAILVPIETLWTIHEKEGYQKKNSAPAIVINPRSIAEAYQLRADYGKDGSMAIFSGEILVRFYSTMADIRTLLTGSLIAIYSILFLLIITIFFTFAKIREARYLALRALGASRAYIALNLWLGTSAVILMGFIIAIPVHYFLSYLLNALIYARTGLVLSTGLGWDEVQTMVLVLLCSFFVLAIASMVFTKRSPNFDLLRQ